MMLDNNSNSADFLSFEFLNRFLLLHSWCLPYLSQLQRVSEKWQIAINVFCYCHSRIKQFLV